MIRIFVLLSLVVTTSSFGQDYLNALNNIYLSGVNANGSPFDSKQAYTTALSNQMNADLAKSSLTEEQKLVYKARAAEIFAGTFANPNNNTMTADSVKNMKAVEIEMLAYESKNKVGKEFYAAAGSIGSRTIHFENLSSMIRISKRNMDFYEKALKIDRNYVPALIGRGQWFFYAPKIGGGDTRKAFRDFEAAYKAATSNNLKYEALIWMSQVYFRDKKPAQAAEELAKAAAIYPNGYFHTTVQDANKRGTFFQMK
ncbi:MAG: hypothetical protein ACRC9L_06555 [Brevinema sp.]